jgi:hypothetical protein
MVVGRAADDVRSVAHVDQLIAMEVASNMKPGKWLLLRIAAQGG